MVFFKWLKAVSLQLLGLAILLVVCLAFIVGTTPGLRLVARLTNHYLPGELVINHLEGSLWQHLQFESLTYKDKDQTFLVHHARLKWRITSLYPFQIALETLELNQLAMVHEKKQLLVNARFKTEQDKLYGVITLGENQVTIEGPFQGPWNIHGNLPKLSQISPELKVLETKLSFDATITDTHHASLKAKLTAGKYHLPEHSTPEWIQFKDAALQANLSPKGLILNGFAALDDNMTSRIQLNVANVSLTKPPKPKAPIQGTVKLSVPSLKTLDTPATRASLGEFALYFQEPDGQLDASLDIQGTLEKPILKGHLKLAQARVNLPTIGLQLDPIEANVHTDGITWQANAVIRTNKAQSLTLNGSGKLTPAFTGKAIIQGESVAIMNTPEYQVEVSPNITLTAKPDTYEIDGTILVPKAHIAPVSFTHAVRLTEDATFTDDNTNPNPLNLTAGIAIEMGDDVTVDIKGLQGHVDGLLHINQQPKQALTARGKLALKDGFYEAYGQKLNIEQGELLFLGQQIDNPYVRIRAIRHFNRTNDQFEGSNELFDFSDENLDHTNLGNHTTVGIIVKGKLDAPQVKLFSVPPNLSQADILSMLLLGKPADRASKSSGRLLLQAMQTLHLDSGSKGFKMLQDFKKSMGVDFDVQNSSLGTSKSDWSKTSVSVGKSITKRVYLQYNVGLFQENSNVFTLTYLLNKFLSIKVTASDIGSGIDVMYSHSD